MEPQPIAEHNADGSRTDYVYANGRKIAKLAGMSHRIHLQGTVVQGGWEMGLNLQPPSNFVARSGDKVCWSQFNQNVVGGIDLQFSTGTQTAWRYFADDGQQMNQDFQQGGWQQRCANIPSEFFGSALLGTVILKDVATSPGSWSMLISDWTYIRSDGSVIPQPEAITGTQGLNASYDTAFSGTVEDVLGSSPPKYYLDDHLGTVQMELSAGGWPLWQGTFTPFGQEIVGSSAYRFFGQQPADGTDNHYKFTGKERDAESGLDYFGARYMSSSMGRFMSPDPISFQARMLYDPQSFNLYSYVRNNPLSLTDPTGEAIELTGDDAARKKELDALKNGVGAKAGSYLYDNAQTDKNGVTTHYVGILSGGPDGKGPSFDSINSASGALSGIVNDSHTAALGIVNPGTEKEGVVIGPVPNTPGLTGDFGGKIMSYIMDTTQKSAGRLPGDMMSNGRPGEINSGILAFHELGHQMYTLQHPIADWFDSLTGGSRSNQQAVDLENKVRQTQHPNGPTRTEH